MKKIWICLIVVLSFVSCGKKENKKEIIVYTAMENQFIGKYIENFNKDYPDIKVNVISGGTGDILAKVIAEKENPQADVLWSLSDVMLLKKYNLLKNYIPKEGFKEIPEKYKNKDGLWIGISAWMLGVGVNTEELKKINQSLPTSYFDLLNSEYKNNILMANPSSSGTGYLTVMTFINLFGEEKAWKYMDSLNKNIATYTSSGNAPVQIISRGERVAGFIPAYQGLLIEKEGNYPFKTIFPKEGIGWELEANALINKKEIKPEAKIFLQWLISPKGMELQSETRGFVTNPKYRKLKGYPENIESYLKPRNFDLEISNRDRILKEWESRYGKEN